MKELGLKSKLSKKFKVTTNSKHNYLIAENVLGRGFKATRISQKWVSDITYIQTKDGFLYLTTIMDLYDRKLIGWSLSYTMSADDTSLAAFRMTIKNRPIEKGLIFHSDQGVQYATKKFTNILASYGVIRSMSRKGNCWDNAVDLWSGFIFCCQKAFFVTNSYCICDRILGLKKVTIKTFIITIIFNEKKQILFTTDNEI